MRSDLWDLDLLTAISVSLEVNANHLRLAVSHLSHPLSVLLIPPNHSLEEQYTEASGNHIILKEAIANIEQPKQSPSSKGSWNTRNK